jgi:glutamate-1-semialdehyde 2,1-aminomutase
MLASGINLAPSPFESGFVSGAHTEQEFAATLDAADTAFKNI